MSVSRTVSEIFSVKEWRDLEAGDTGIVVPYVLNVQYAWGKIREFQRIL